MSTNIREEIDKYLVSILQDNSSLIRHVDRRFVGLDLESGSIQGISPHDMPAVIVNSGNMANDFTGPATGGKSYFYTPELVGYVHDMDSYYTELNSLVTEVIKILFSNRQVDYNGTCIALIQDFNSLLIDRGRLAPLGAFTMELQIRTQFDPATGGELT